MDPFQVLVKCEADESAPAAAARKRGVGRLVDSTQADDRHMIALVRERPLLYARSNLPVASYHSQVKKLWREVADIMGWTVADVRRKWSHIRNSYSRHLRNEMHGVRTGRGRIVSKWYLADALHFLRAHMATDTRPCPMSLVADAPHRYLIEEPGGSVPEPVEPAVEVHTEALLVERPRASLWYAADDASEACEPDDSASYFQFFRGIHKDYRELSPRRQRRFRRQCLVFLHRLLDGEEADAAAAPLRHYSSDSGGESALPH